MTALEHLSKVMYTRKAPTQRGTIISLMRGSWASFEVARDLGISQNAANMALHELVKHGVVERPIRGRYRVKEHLVILLICDRIRELENKNIKSGSVAHRRPRRSQFTSTTAPQPAHGGEPS